MNSRSQRSDTTCPLFGLYSPLDCKQLPTLKDVIKYILFVKNELQVKYNGKHPSNSEAFAIRNDRRIVIGAVDKEETSKIQKRLERKIQKSSVTMKNDLQRTSGSSVWLPQLPPDEPKRCQNLKSEVSVDFSEPSTSSRKRNTLSLPSVARVCDRYGLSSRSAAAVTSAVLQDVGIITSSDTSLVIDKNKIHRALSKSRNRLQQNDNMPTIKSIYFDGRKDKTLVLEKIIDRFHRKEISEEHISILCEPGSVYLGHVTPTSSTGKGISDSLMNFIRINDWELQEIVCVGCDGTATNTGCKGGAIRYLEQQLGRLLQWLICLLHANELPLRHLFTTLDGSTSGPREYSGPIGKALVSCESKSVVTFASMPTNIPEIEQNVVD
ncbi:hypothetical protein KPH14_012625 [Odynerus spinipes]|uniref:Uncharacterized protein n=1 Tax=Odynerus spinipes TaxID=1348599 RepID=A0AAD9REL1_9HYME|nr:hypothetical protein KPH14_012625 [Odynerus spinipes]